jgi:1-deoxy-D-xylulose-5-phosphate reductoisomerase
MASTVTILGSTGSIGVSTLRVIQSFPESFTVYGLSCNKNLDKLKEQIVLYRPGVVAVSDNEAINSEQYHQLVQAYPEIRFLTGSEGVEELASQAVDILVSAIVGAAGLKPTMAAMGSARRIAIANKETLVMAGPIVMDTVKRMGVELLPVDSEHNAIFSLMRNKKPVDINKIIITASGGSLRDYPLEKLNDVTPEEALRHPTWDMGDKIAIDSATLMNKGLEVIEAHHLFDISFDAIDVVIHPESVVHGMVELIDGSVIAHMSIADMALPIYNALTYPNQERHEFGSLDIKNLGSLSFRGYEPERYPALDLCYRAGRTGGTMPAVLNAANEEAVYAFLSGKTGFTDIVKIVATITENHQVVHDPGLEQIYAADTWARQQVKEYIRGK